VSWLFGWLVRLTPELSATLLPMATEEAQRGACCAVTFRACPRLCLTSSLLLVLGAQLWLTNGVESIPLWARWGAWHATVSGPRPGKVCVSLIECMGCDCADV
jgi:hypothetical protein